MKLSDLEKTEIPEIKLTKSITSTTGTITFVFTASTIVEKIKINKKPIFHLCIPIENYWRICNDVQIKIKNGKPIKILFVFLIKNTYEWSKILKYLISYSKKHKLKFIQNDTFN